MKRFKFLTWVALGVGAAAPLLAETISRSTEYISPMGDYKEVTASKTFTTGIEPQAPTAGAPPTPNPSDASTSVTTVYGNAYVRGRDVILDESIAVDGDTFKIYPLYKYGHGTHWLGIGIGIAEPQTEGHVNGDIQAQSFAAAYEVGTSDNGEMLYMGVSSDGHWGEIGAKNGSGFGWNDPESMCRFRGSPTVILNRYSNGNVGIGTTAPAYMLQVGDTGSGLKAVGWKWEAFSSRDYKTDIRPLAPADYPDLYSKMRGLDMVRYRYKGSPPGSKLHVGVLVEEAPAEILTDDKTTLDTTKTVAVLLGMVKQLKKENEELERKVSELETSLGERP